MSAKFFPDVPDYIRGWFRLRAERKAMRKATDDLDRSPDNMLSDIGISHDEIMCAFQKRQTDHRTLGRNSQR
jgi:uncharacterized protein YjiS (DUF1127 family)